LEIPDEQAWIEFEDVFRPFNFLAFDVQDNSTAVVGPEDYGDRIDSSAKSH